LLQHAYRFIGLKHIWYRDSSLGKKCLAGDGNFGYNLSLDVLLSMLSAGIARTGGEYVVFCTCLARFRAAEQEKTAGGTLWG
jgi:hypothetical protein